MKLVGVYILHQNVKNNFVENGRDGEGGIVLVSSLLSIKIFQSMFDEWEAQGRASPGWSPL